LLIHVDVVGELFGDDSVNAARNTRVTEPIDTTVQRRIHLCVKWWSNRFRSLRRTHAVINAHAVKLINYNVNVIKRSRNQETNKDTHAFVAFDDSGPLLALQLCFTVLHVPTANLVVREARRVRVQHVVLVCVFTPERKHEAAIAAVRVPSELLLPLVPDI